MTTTTAPKPGKIGRGRTLKQLQKDVSVWLQWARDDYNKAPDLDEASYWKGQVHALEDVLLYLERPQLPRGNKLMVVIPIAVAVTHLIHENRKDNQPDA